MATSIESKVRVVITVLVGAIGGAIGFWHTREWAVDNGQDGLVSWGIAVVVESLAIVAALELRRRYGHGVLAVLVAAFTLQMAAQVAGARDTVAGWLLAASPALSFLIIVKFGLRAAADAETARQPARLQADDDQAPAVEPRDESVLDVEVREIETPVQRTSAETAPAATVSSPAPVAGGW
uniref:DUF2637 domain-containing protein n=1 Tax=Amycolatopsis sp. CA-290885 TaxID=3239925 RepID=UPI003F4926B0